VASLRQQIATTTLTLTKFRDLMRRMKESRPQDDLTIIKKAYEYSLKHHEGQTRASGEPYLIHPLEVALVLAEMTMDLLFHNPNVTSDLACNSKSAHYRECDRQNRRLAGTDL
jgi:hypothetical protein